MFTTCVYIFDFRINILYLIIKVLYKYNGYIYNYKNVGGLFGPLLPNYLLHGSKLPAHFFLCNFAVAPYFKFRLTNQFIFELTF